MASSIFLTAHWRYLTLFNYSVPEELLIPYLPRDCELDKYDKKAFVSLVAFQFLKTKVWNIQWPYFINFTEINLRFYVSYKKERGVCFIREFVPRQLIVYVAKKLYNEPYKKAEMSNNIEVTDEKLKVHYYLKYKNHPMKIDLLAKNSPYMTPENSKEHFFKEHSLGVGRDKKGNTLLYKVKHPHWEIFPIYNFSLQLDWEGIFGKKFAFLNKEQPESVFLAKGSPIEVHKKEKVLI